MKASFNHKVSVLQMQKLIGLGENRIINVRQRF